jgi:carnitine O-acetyltransferase
MSIRSKSWKSVAPGPSSLTAPTFAAQASLQRLPVPDLASALVTLKESIVPLAWSDQEYAAAEKKIDQFARSTQATELIARLLTRAQETNNWLESWWDDAAYLSYRDSVCLTISFFSSHLNLHMS